MFINNNWCLQIFLIENVWWQLRIVNKIIFSSSHKLFKTIQMFYHGYALCNIDLTLSKYTFSVFFSLFFFKFSWFFPEIFELHLVIAGQITLCYRHNSDIRTVKGPPKWCYVEINTFNFLYGIIFEFKRLNMYKCRCHSSSEKHQFFSHIIHVYLRNDSIMY